MKLTSSPDESLLLDGLAGGEHGVHVGLVVPGLDVQKDGGLGDEGGLLGLLLVVGLQPLLPDPDLLRILLLVGVGAEEVDVIVVVVIGGGGSRSGGLATLLEAANAVLEGEDELLEVVADYQRKPHW